MFPRAALGRGLDQRILMQISRKTSFAAGAVMALVLGSGTAYAATGGTFILGKANTAGTTTVLSNAKGTALMLNSKSGTPSLKVNRTTKVPNLNADLLDGISSNSLALTSGRTGYVTAPGTWADLDGDGVDDVILAVADCPAGSMLTGGGSSDFTSTGVVVDDSPFGGGSWVAVALADPTDVASDLEAHAVCYNPRGRVAGAVAARTSAKTTDTARSQYLSELSARLADRK
jgi:hypothetical protein